MNAIRDKADVVVIGSGMAGICSAIQAGRLGCSVTLLEKDDVLGGNSSPNLGVHISGAHSFHPFASETGIINEIEEEAARLNVKLFTHGYHYNIARQWDTLLEVMLREAGVKVFRRTYAREAKTNGQEITEVLAEDMATFNTLSIKVGVAVIDASGDGHIAASAGAKFRMGREKSAHFDERSAPQRADDKTMGTSVTALVRKTDHPVKFVPPPGTPPFEVGYGYGREEVVTDCVNAHAAWNPDADLCFLYHTETGGELNTISDDHQIYDRLIGQLYSVWNHIKNEAHPEESRNWELVWVSPKAGKRESRRFIGDYTLNQRDVESGRIFEDEVGYGGYAVDVHDPVGHQAKVNFHSVPRLYSIPFRCLYSRDLDNLFLAGRLISVSHIALGTVRLQKTLATGGQAVGAAAWLCKRYSCSPREIYEKHIRELKQLLLRNDATLLGTPNRDENDLARRSKISASSEQKFDSSRLDEWLPLDRTRGLMFWDWPRHLNRIMIYLRNDTSREISIPARLEFFKADKKWKNKDENIQPGHIEGQSNRMSWGGDNRIKKFQKLSFSETTVPPEWQGWTEIDFHGIDLPDRDPLSDEERMVLCIPPANGLYWGQENASMDVAFGCWTDEKSETYLTGPEVPLFKISPQPVYGEASNVVNGFSRRFCTNPVNMWISERGEPLPQDLTFEFPKQVNIAELHLTFDTLYRAFRDMPFNHPEREAPGMCVSSYLMEYLGNDDWCELFSVEDNYKRFRIHKFDKISTSKLKLTVLSTIEEGWPARVYQVKIYPP